ncbi:MAG: hypothetical protein ACJA2G_001610, partial [Cognaticolwellia sp.]
RHVFINGDISTKSFGEALFSTQTKLTRAKLG